MNGQDNRLKYLELFRSFEYLANEVKLSCKVSQRNCERLAKQVASTKAKTPEQFEKVESLKEFINSTSTANEKTVNALNTIHGYLVEIASDCNDLTNVADLKNKIEIQSETISILMQQNQNIVSLRDEIRRRNTATA
jgi:uncharacterized protein YoxC